jgi:Kef-type K+ transport system membrane component KefB
MNATQHNPDGFLHYNEPSIISLLTLISFFLFLSLAEWLSDTLFKAGLIGQILVGILYGLPVGNIMDEAWQETFVSLGYLGIILIIFEGGLSVRTDLLKQNLITSLCAATLGVLTPISLCYLMLYLGFHFGELCAVFLSRLPVLPSSSPLQTH